VPSPFASGDLRDARRDAKLPERTLVAATPAVRDRPEALPAEVAPPEARELDPPESTLPELAPSESAESAAATLPPPTLPEPPPALEETLIASETEEALAPEESPPEPSLEPLPAGSAAGWELPRWPFLFGCLVFLLAAIAGATLGGTYPPLTALACGLLGIAVVRP
jgi:hypothetical protein